MKSLIMILSLFAFIACSDNSSKTAEKTQSENTNVVVEEKVDSQEVIKDVSPAKQDVNASEAVNLTTLTSTISFKTDSGLITLTSPDSFKTATLTMPNGESQELQAPVPGDGNPLPANGMLLLNKNGYSIHVANDNSANLKTPSEEIELSNGELSTN